jgi:hypothetical protein
MFDTEFIARFEDHVMSAKPRKKQTYSIARAINKPGSDVGKKRHDLYANAHRQIAKARARGFFIECIAVCASIIEDRLESRRQCVYYEDPSKHNFATLGELLKALPKVGSSDDKQIKQLYTKIRKWSYKRNRAIHQMVKYGAERHRAVWKVRYKALRKTLDDGIELARQISQKVEHLNDSDKKHRAKTVQ